MTSSYSANSIRNQLGDLSLDSPPEERLSPEHKSLLSKSLAQDERGGSTARVTSPPQGVQLDVQDTGLTDEHPEPELLATSVGKDIDGRLIPSSSTISLLSLNTNGNFGSAATQYSGFPHILDRKNSHSGLGSRNSLTRLNHQRLQPYHKLASTQESSSPATQSIPMVRNAGAMLSAPDSPNLDPTSLGGSPSRFWLGSQTPPKSLSGSYNKRSCTLQLTQLHNTQQLHNTSGSIRPGTSTGSGHTARAFRGDDSPILNPVQTPLEDMPMTPLYLNSEADSYFVYTKGGNHSNQKRELFQYDEEESEEEQERGPENS
ncbi:hypothetical protein FT663_00929 [Candidozyma haemuli var. vulneris]|uniref:Uncharacterized protein n=1 Tax=Candidozyma haemuli TaxID=45357 RepID=A0A2V1AQM5_9ASCO|nr:hypothetical protein CXQ85_001874 [[Candida] haemuloni]KAF3993105.1 hypothetical protein FT662_00733 [[Candida] haemuloni var. vulneris]KAF3994955.1 hypothetical protein FT663_00929 [[Candida] haemuloni var. vulneris]PVH20095.1 hypothetical protein CXQ85_001874 [[Candida] haemuloni]